MIKAVNHNPTQKSVHVAEPSIKVEGPGQAAKFYLDGTFSLDGGVKLKGVKNYSSETLKMVKG